MDNPYAGLDDGQKLDKVLAGLVDNRDFAAGMIAGAGEGQEEGLWEANLRAHDDVLAMMNSAKQWLPAVYVMQDALSYAHNEVETYLTRPGTGRNHSVKYVMAMGDIESYLTNTMDLWEQA